MKLVALAALFATAPLVSSPSTPPNFQGRIDLRLQDADPQGADYAVRGDKLRIDIPSIGGTHDVHAVIDLTRNRALVRSAGGGWSTQVAYPRAVEPERISIERTGRMRAVVGQPCEVWRMTDGPTTVEACVVPGIPWLDPRQIVGEHVPDWSRALQARRAFPLSVWAENPQTRFAMWATDVRRGGVPSGEFEVPRTARGR